MNFGTDGYFPELDENVDRFIIKDESSYSLKTANDMHEFESSPNLNNENCSLSHFPSVGSLNSNSSNSSGSSNNSTINNTTLTLTNSSLPYVNPVSPSSSGSSISFPSDMSNHLMNVNYIYNASNTVNDFNQTEWNPDSSLGSMPNLDLLHNSRKHDVSVGTEFSNDHLNESKSLFKDSQWNPSLKNSNRTCNRLDPTLASSSACIFNQSSIEPSSSCSSSNNGSSHMAYRHSSSSESFRLIEKILPKKSRTKYSKDQLQLLEEAYARCNYPDVISVETLCKQLDISREKINIWFQNRRARSKRGSSKIKNINPSTNNSAVSLCSTSAINQINNRLFPINSNPSAQHIQQSNMSVVSSPTLWSNSMLGFVSSGYET